MDTDGFRLKIFSLLLVAILLIGTVGFTYIEHLHPVDAVYFTVVTLATVGYGDIHPLSREGKLLAMFVIILGVGTFLAFFASTTDMLLKRRERLLRREKINMVIELFYGEVGTDLLSSFAAADPHVQDIREELSVKPQWSEADFERVRTRMKGHSFTVDVRHIDMPNLRTFLRDNTPLFLRILQNPYLLEHEAFSELMRAVLHLKEELIHRSDFSDLPKTDLDHLAHDVKRVYGLMARQWVDYLEYLKKNYPYLFSLAVRLNPFSADRSPIVR